MRLRRLETLVETGPLVWADELDSPPVRGGWPRSRCSSPSWGAPLTPSAWTPRRTSPPSSTALAVCAPSSAGGLAARHPRDERGRRKRRPRGRVHPRRHHLRRRRRPSSRAVGEVQTTGWGHRVDYGDLSNYRRTIGIVGFSRIGRRVVELLRLPLRRGDGSRGRPLRRGPRGGSGGRSAWSPSTTCCPGSTCSASPSCRPHHLLGPAELAALPDRHRRQPPRGALVDTGR